MIELMYSSMRTVYIYETLASV